MAGLEVTPRSESSRTRRASSPVSIRLRRIWSSQTLVPAAVRAASLGLICAVTLIGSARSTKSGLDCPGRGSLGHRTSARGDLLGGEAEVLVERPLGA